MRQLGGEQLLQQLGPGADDLLAHPGLAEAGRLLEQLLDPAHPDGPLPDLGALMDSLSKTIDPTDEALGRLFQGLGAAIEGLGKNDKKPSEVFRDLGRELRQGGKQTEKLLESMESFLEALEQEPPQQQP